MVATIYYLDWAHDNADEAVRDQFIRLQFSDPDTAPDTLPIDQYRRVGTTHIADDIADDMDAVDHIYARWNNTDDTDPDAHDTVFKTVLMCERCGAVFGTTTDQPEYEPANRHAEDEHGWVNHLGRPDNLPDYIHGLRSMSVGDVIDLDGTLYMVAGKGFAEVEWG